MEVNIQEKMKEQRKLKNITQVDLAAKIGISQDLYSRYENGKLNIPSALIPDICYFLDLTPNDLFEYERFKVRFYSKNNNNRFKKTDPR